jgi:2-polyprenylphenol 6-hydroxylase
MRVDADIVIVGGGLAGACMASLLARPGKLTADRIALVEPRLQLRQPAAKDIDLRVSAISRASERILSACGVWDRLPGERIGPYERMCVWDEGGKAQGSGAIRFDCADIGQPNLGYVLENSVMQFALLHRAQELGVRLISGQVATLELQGDAMAVGLQDGSRLHTRLVIAADGADSPARGMMGIATRGAAYAQRAIVTHIRSDESHRRTAWQRFLSTGPIALLPLRDGADDKRCSIVWSTTEQAAQQLMTAGDSEFCRAVSTATDGVVGTVLDCTRRVDFPLRHLHAERYVTPRFALVGDAAHAIHPLAGQGVNLGFLDCAALAQAIDEALARGTEPGDFKILRRYERWRKGENLLMLAALDGLNRLFSNDSRPLGLLRRSGLTVTDRIAPLKTQFMRRALGLAGDLPAAAVQ